MSAEAKNIRPADDWRWHLKCIEHEMEMLRSAGVIEVAVRNPSVAEYMKHWEGRAEKAEAEVERLRAAVPTYYMACEKHRGQMGESYLGLAGNYKVVCPLCTRVAPETP